MMDIQTIALVIAGGGTLGLVVWVLAKIGRALIKTAEAMAAAAAVFLALWLMIKAVMWALRQTLTHWRTSPDPGGAGRMVALGAPTSLVIAVAVIVGLLIGWWLFDVASFDAWAGRHLRGWWLRWTIYAPKLHACGLGIEHDAVPVVLAITPLARALGRNRRAATLAQPPKVLGVRSGASWDLVRVRLIPGQKPEDFDEATRALASARGATRCQVRELTPNVVSIDFQRRNLLTDPVLCQDLSALTGIPGSGVDLRRGVVGAQRVRQRLVRPLGRRPYLGRRSDRGGQELRDVVPTRDHRPGHPGWSGAGVRD